MVALVWTWLALIAGVCLVWLARHRQISVARRERMPLRGDMFASDSDALPRLSVLVAAKDEESNIETCLRSLLEQDYPDLEIIAVNDRSDDRTGEIIDAVAVEDKRLRAVHVTELRPGWFGKNNAMREAVERSTGEWLCFTDADCFQTSPRSLTVALRYALENRCDFLSVLPRFEARTFWERVIQPACGGIMMIWFSPVAVNNPNKPNAYANGAFMLLHRSCYEAIGGHEPVKTEVNEDVHMARRAKEAGRRLLVVMNEDLYRVRMYESVGQMWAGWSRIFYGCFQTYRRLVLSALAVFVFSLGPWLTLAAIALARVLGAGVPGPQESLTIAAVVAATAQVTVMARFYSLSRIGPHFAFLYPLGAAIGLAALVNAMRRLRGRATTTWRGTTYRGDQIEANHPLHAAEKPAAPPQATTPMNRRTAGSSGP